MKINKLFAKSVILAVVAVLVLSGEVMAQSSGETPSKTFSREQLDQLLAPVALYPDSLLTQILIASTYPLEVVKAMNWVKHNKDLKGDVLTNALEKQEWDPSVKSLVNFPQVLEMMEDKLDWTQKLGDAFLSQQKDVMAAVQKLRGKAQAEGNLKTTKEQKVVVEKETIIIEPASPQVIYVPAYNPTVVYGAWPYPAYPPYYYYPPGYATGAAAFGFASGVAVGAAWGYAWGHSDWHGGNVDIDVNRNADINRNIDRSKYQGKGQLDQSGKGTWQHDTSHRQGVAYKDSATAQKFGQSTGSSAQARSESRGYGNREGADRQAGGLTGETKKTGGAGRGGRESAFSGAGNGNFEQRASERGQMSRGSGMGGASRGEGGFGGGRGRGRR